MKMPMHQQAKKYKSEKRTKKPVWAEVLKPDSFLFDYLNPSLGSFNFALLDAC